MQARPPQARNQQDGDADDGHTHRLVDARLPGASSRALRVVFRSSR